MIGKEGKTIMGKRIGITAVLLLASSALLCVSCGEKKGVPIDFDFADGPLSESFSKVIGSTWKEIRSLEETYITVKPYPDSSVGFSMAKIDGSDFGESFWNCPCLKTEDIDRFGKYFSRASTYRVSSSTEEGSIVFYVDYEISGITYSFSTGGVEKEESWLVDTPESLHRSLERKILSADMDGKYPDSTRRVYTEEEHSEPSGTFPEEIGLVEAVAKRSDLGEKVKTLTPVLTKDPLTLSRYNGAYFNTALTTFYNKDASLSGEGESAFFNYLGNEKGTLGQGGVFFKGLAPSEKTYGRLRYSENADGVISALTLTICMDKERLVFFWTYQGETYFLLLQSSEDIYRLFVPHCLMAL
jgi:hypothetical protein